MSTMNDIFHDPSFKKDFAFIRQLETQNKAYQDKIWEKFVGTFNKNDDDIRIVNTRFESHPSGLSSESEKSIHIVQDDWMNEASFKLSSSSLELKSLREKSKSSSGNKILLHETERKKLHKKLTKHLQNGTLDKFEVKNIGDHPSKNSRSESDKKKDQELENNQEVYLDRWSKSNSMLSISKSASQSTVNEEKDDKEEAKAPSAVERKMSEEIKLLREELKETEKIGQKMKSRTTTVRKTKSTAAKESKKFTIEVNISTELRKSKYYIEKCIGVIKDISMIMNNGIMPPDGSEDYSRRQVRTKEFTSRFSRTYLYPLLTQLSKLSVVEKGSTIHSKFTSLYQLTYQALQSCFNHLPNTVGTTSYQKLRECLNCAIDICERSRKYFEKEENYDNEDYVCIFKSHCVDLSHKIEDNFLSISAESLLYSKSTRTSLAPPCKNNRNMAHISESKKSLQKRYSMYNSNLAQKRDKQWRKMLAAFEEKKPKVKSRYRTATFKHRPPIEKINSQIMVQPRQHRLDEKKSLILLRNTPVVTPINEDNIQTMILPLHLLHKGSFFFSKVKSRYRTATFKHRPPIEKINSQIMVQPRQHRLDEKKSLILLRNTPVVTPINEDNIQTMIQYENERIEGGESEKEVLEENDEEMAEKHNTTFFVDQTVQGTCGDTGQKEDILTKLLQLVQDTDDKNPAEMDSNLTNTIMVLQKCLNFKNQNTELMKKKENGDDQNLAVQSNTMEIIESSDNNEKKKKKEPKVTVTGTKNAQLICIKDENSIGSVSDENEETRNRRNSKDSSNKNLKSTQVQTCESELFEEDVPKLNRSKSSIRIGRMRRPRKVLQLLPKDYAINIIQYKLMFYKHHKGNYMYKKTSTTKPWELMDKISEDILDYALLGIAKEIEVNELLENIYNAEFQY
ncbi:uncharacterized protein LOC123316808 [Coccinella septempunctata]|uniref:uncharacterized protein LOC123316808 n=1 Tax=Coccinella septempunctata TaxID=41139 RepID=UPI001D079BEC|nr:uncharacterized protein LOC123316808 [Coccinella septempunctata]